MIIKVNFGNENSALPSDEFILDFGQGYSEKGYGWVTQASLDGETAIPIDLLTNTRDRDLIDEQSTDTLIHLQYPDDLTGTRPEQSIKTPSAWEYDLENGTYQITVSVGDPEFTDSNHVVNIEGESAIAGFAPTENELFREVTTTVEVADGKLTLDAIGGENTKLNFVEIVPEDSIDSSDSDIDENTTPEAIIPDTTETDGEEDSTPTNSADTEGDGDGEDSTPTDSADTEGEDSTSSDSTDTDTDSDGEEAVDGDGEGEGEDSTPTNSADTDTEDTDSTADAVTPTDSDASEGEDSIPTDSADTDGDGEEAVDGDGDGEDSTPTNSTDTDTEDTDSTPDAIAPIEDGSDSDGSDGEDSTIDTDTEDTGSTPDAITPTDSANTEGDDADSTPDAVTPTDSDAGESEGEDSTASNAGTGTITGLDGTDGDENIEGDTPTNSADTDSDGEVDSNTDSVTSEEDSEGDISADPEGTGSDVPEDTDTSGDAGGEVGIPVEGGGVVETVEPIDGGFNFNFGVPRVDGPSEFTQDLGEAYDTERGYGWVTQESAGSENLTPVDVVVNGRDRDTLFNDGQGGQFREPVRDSLIHMQYSTGLPNSSQSVTTPAAWEYEIADGQYEVTVGVGDPTFFDSNHVINVEGENLISGFVPTGFEVNGSLPVDGQAFSQSSGIVEVTDGSLTLDAIGGENTKVNYISIIPVDAT